MPARTPPERASLLEAWYGKVEHQRAVGIEVVAPFHGHCLLTPNFLCKRASRPKDSSGEAGEA